MADFMVEATFSNEYDSAQQENVSGNEKKSSEETTSGFSGWSMLSATASGLSSFFQKVKETTADFANAATEDLKDMTNQIREDTANVVDCLFISFLVFFLNPFFHNFFFFL